MKQKTSQKKEKKSGTDIGGSRFTYTGDFENPVDSLKFDFDIKEDYLKVETQKEKNEDVVSKKLKLDPSVSKVCLLFIASIIILES